MRQKYYLFLFLIFCSGFARQASAQDDDLLKLAEAADSTSSNASYTTGIFKGTRIITGHSVQTNAQKELVLIISHRFGTLNSGAYNFFGLDNAVMRLALEYGLTDNLNVGVGRSSYQKTFDGFLKYRFLRQQEGGWQRPVSAVLFGSAALNSLRPGDPERDVMFKSRLTYTTQLLIARKFNQNLSLQLAPTWIHRNLVPTRRDESDVYAIGLAGRHKLTKRTSFNAEYFYLLPSHTADTYTNALSLSFDIETGGHVFQLLFSNSIGMIEKNLIADNMGTWKNGDIFFGFNISRVFDLDKSRKMDKKKY
ncbi:hypothetical protein AHMF7605_07555 [Adhaeribacter arboris]|uniref:DUF5777 domain-containing protein n=1 Tax=Adhaeribacter arboris TaxID=2072846 RepID=A0A2T2YCZ4_9BACT|nr:DUF5777 family beta-barrel protein [Adhaeribacter arboris]PSR53392.1 hypothetical protein AHMF7605_07555 [Adhaeribacter arboris]